VRGAAWLSVRVDRTSWSVNTLQEQTIMTGAPGGKLVRSETIPSASNNAAQSKNISL
jgi:hypothetical protein